MGESEMLQKQPSSKKSSEFQQARNLVDQNLQYIPKKALPEKVFTAKQAPAMAAAILEFMSYIAKKHDERVQSGVMAPVNLA